MKNKNQIDIFYVNFIFLIGFIMYSLIDKYSDDSDQNFDKRCFLPHQSFLSPLKIKLTYLNQTTSFFGVEMVPISLGRSSQSCLIVEGSYISRQHATITFNGQFVFSDHSTNGSIVASHNHDSPVILLKESIILENQGIIVLGIHRSPEIYYEIYR